MHMCHYSRVSLLLSLRLLVSSAVCAPIYTPVYAWDVAGHQITALVSYEQLPTEYRSSLVSLLGNHRRFKTDFLNTMPARIRRASSQAQGEWLFARAAAWPDRIRKLPPG
jgi:hypothetical protein